MNVGEDTSKSKGKGAKTQHAAQQAQEKGKEGEGAAAKGAKGTRGQVNAAKGQEHQDRASRASPQGGKGRGEGQSAAPDNGNVDLLKGMSARVQNILGNSAAQLGKGGEKIKGFGNFTTEGTGGLALSGGGHGGGGNAETLGGTSNKGTGGGRVGTGKGAVGTGTGIIGGQNRLPVIRTGGAEETIVMGAIDKDAVEAAILAHKDEFRLCYEREINAENPNLAGRVWTSFTIGSSGRVTEAGIASSTLKNANAERCVLGVLRRIAFPIPRGGGEVQVNYPFKFNSVGSQ
jgi:TonB family protein